MPSCSKVHESMQNLTRLVYTTSDQHKESSPARQERDRKDTQTLLLFLTDMNPFEGDTSLRSISSGVVAHDKVNVDKAKEIVVAIMQSMTNVDALTYTFLKKD